MHWCTQEKKGTPRVRLSMSISRLEATRQRNCCILETGISTTGLLDTGDQQSEEGTSEFDPWEQSVPGKPNDTEAAATSSQVKGGEGTSPQVLKSDNPRVCWRDPLLHGVYPEILSLAGWLEI